MIQSYDPIIQSLFASLFTWGVTALGAALVFVLPSDRRRGTTILDVSLGFAGGVMTAASFWSLLAPAIEISEAQLGALAFIPVSVGFAFGAIFVFFSDKMIPSCVGAELSIIEVLSSNKEVIPTGANSNNQTEVLLNSGQGITSNEGGESSFDPRKRGMDEGLRERTTLAITSRKALRDDNNPNEDNNNKIAVNETTNDRPSTQQSSNNSDLLISWRRILMLIMAVTVHNFPEGLAVGIGFGSIGKTPAATFEKAFNLALGIGLQNFPEGLAVSLPLASFGYSPFRAFLYGQLSGMVEPLAALLGSSAVLLMEAILPYALSFAAGAMIYVVFDSIIPEACSHGNGKMASASAIIGFLVMMCLDVGLS
uniref:Zinc transporter ZIP11 n=1 Tax=Meloidogyne incognita TaxID=6306 RepID=A0A914L4R4_MELIC